MMVGWVDRWIKVCLWEQLNLPEIWHLNMTGIGPLCGVHAAKLAALTSDDSYPSCNKN